MTLSESRKIFLLPLSSYWTVGQCTTENWNSPGMRREWKGEVLLSAGAGNFVSQDCINTGLTDHLTAKLTLYFLASLSSFLFSCHTATRKAEKPRETSPKFGQIKSKSISCSQFVLKHVKTISCVYEAKCPQQYNFPLQWLFRILSTNKALLHPFL